jgi:hypothetical protein
MAEYEDVEIVCADCKKAFLFTAGEQQFFAERGFTPPKRCKPCRDQRKARRNAAQHSTERPQQHAALGDWHDVWEEDHKPRRRRRR